MHTGAQSRPYLSQRLDERVGRELQNAVSDLNVEVFSKCLGEIKHIPVQCHHTFGSARGTGGVEDAKNGLCISVHHCIMRLVAILYYLSFQRGPAHKGE